MPDLFKAAGARMIFDGQAMKELIELVEEKLQKLDG
jgi:hypothetical protein